MANTIGKMSAQCNPQFVGLTESRQLKLGRNQRRGAENAEWRREFRLEIRSPNRGLSVPHCPLRISAAFASLRFSPGFSIELVRLNLPCATAGQAFKARTCPRTPNPATAVTAGVRVA